MKNNVSITVSYFNADTRCHESHDFLDVYNYAFTALLKTPGVGMLTVSYYKHDILTYFNVRVDMSTPVTILQRKMED